MRLIIFIVFFLLVVAAGAGMHALSYAIGFWPYMLLCLGGGSLMIAGGFAWDRLTGGSGASHRDAAGSNNHHG